MENYQRWFVESVGAAIATNWYLRRPAIRVLDMGCDPSGLQLRAISRLTAG